LFPSEESDADEVFVLWEEPAEEDEAFLDETSADPEATSGFFFSGADVFFILLDSECVVDCFSEAYND